MGKRIIRRRFYLPVEGASKQSLIKWVGDIAAQNGLCVYLDCEPLAGGGYKSLLKKAKDKRKERNRINADFSILVVDSDRAERGDDGWTLSQLRKEASKHKMDIFVLYPNLEGFLFRLFPGNEKKQIDSRNAIDRLRTVWPDYQKPTDARSLSLKYDLEDLLRLARVDVELRNLLDLIGLLSTTGNRLEEVHPTYEIECC